MDDNDIKHALRRYVTTGAPPFPLAASDLLAKGRQRQLLRFGLACLSSGSMVILTALVASGALTNPPAPAYPGLYVPGCGRSLPVARPNVGQTEPPFEGTSTPVYVEPSQYSSAAPTHYPSVDPSSHPPESPPQNAVDLPSQLPGDLEPEATQWPSVAPQGPMPQDADPAKLAVMACYVKGAALILFPNSSFAPASEPPMEVIRLPELDFTTGWQPTYNVRAMVVDGGRASMFLVRVTPLAPGSPPPPPSQMEVRQLGNGRIAYIDREPYQGYVRVTTRHTSIAVMTDAGLLSNDQAIALALAPELDVFG